MKKSICMRVLVLATASLIAMTQAYAFDKAGRTAFQFVKIGIGARQTALGEAGIAYVRDANSVFWNPAGITGISSSEASVSFSRWFADMNIYSAVAGFRWTDIGVFALSMSTLQYGDIQESLIPLAGASADSRTGNTFTGHDLMVGLAYSREFTDQLSIGIQAKFLEEKLFTYNVNIFAFDAGTYYDFGYKGLRLAMSAQNFGPSVKWLELSNRREGYDIPLSFRIGFSGKLLDPKDGFLSLGALHHFSACLEAVHTNDFGDRFQVGAEYEFSDFLALRGGYRFNYSDGNLSLGIGLHQRLSGMDLRLDYSYVTYDFLESPHRITLAFAF